MKCSHGSIGISYSSTRGCQWVDLMGAYSGEAVRSARLTVLQMRRLAAMLTRAADRIEKRKAR